MFKKITSLLLSLIICLSLSVVANAESINNDSATADTRFVSIFQNVADSWEGNRTVETVKTLLDFAGNTYTLAECYPTGYMIFNNESALMMEKAADSPSPYADMNENLYYAGPTHYYTYDVSSAQYIHTISNAVITTEEVSERTDICLNAQAEMNAIADVNMRAFLENGTVNTVSVQPLSSDGYTYVGDHKDFFTNLTTHTLMGYYQTPDGDGCCAYVAAGLVLLYYDYFHNDKFIDNKTYLSTTGDAFKGQSFAEHLYVDIGKKLLKYDNELNATEAAKVMQKYLSEDRSITMTYWSASMPSKSTVVSQLKLNRPVIYCDRWNNPKPAGGTVDHAIVVYGYDSSNNLVAHFGWTDYTHVECSSPALALFISSASSIVSYS